MIREVVAGGALIAGLLISSDVAASPAALAVQSGSQVTAADAAPFIGEWILTLEGQNGPGTFDLAVKVEKDKVSAEITHPGSPPQPITDITMMDKTLALSYSFTHEGNAVDAVVRLTPSDEGRMNAQIAFAGGAYLMSGTATKKEKAK